MTGSEILRKAADLIEADFPHKFDPWIWLAIRGNTYSFDEVTPELAQAFKEAYEETGADIAGYIVLSCPGEFVFPKDPETDDSVAVLQRILGPKASHETVWMLNDRIFYLTDWPKRYYDAISHKDKPSPERISAMAMIRDLADLLDEIQDLPENPYNARLQNFI